jgi:hypothetical protein
MHTSISFFPRICFNIVFPCIDITVNTAYLNILEPLDRYYQYFYSIPTFHHSWEEMNVCQEGVWEEHHYTIGKKPYKCDQESIWTPIIASTVEIKRWNMKFEMDKCGRHVFGTILKLTKEKNHTHVICNTILFSWYVLVPMQGWNHRSVVDVINNSHH